MLGGKGRDSEKRGESGVYLRGVWQDMQEQGTFKFAPKEDALGGRGEVGI